MATNFNMLVVAVYETSEGPFTRYIVNRGLTMLGTIFVACDKLATGLRHDLRLSQRFKTCFKML